MPILTPDFFTRCDWPDRDALDEVRHSQSRLPPTQTANDGFDFPERKIGEIQILQ